jgi:hypothetical protein
VALSAAHTVPEEVLGKRRKDRVLECDGATAFNALYGRKQRCWVQLLCHARRGFDRWESVSDAPDWRGLRVLEKIARGMLEASHIPEGSTKRAEAQRLRAHLARWLHVEREGEAAQSLPKFLTKHEGELWWWADAGVAAHNNLAEQALRPHIAKKRKLSWGIPDPRRGGALRGPGEPGPDREDAGSRPPGARRYGAGRRGGPPRVRSGDPE